jgi:hypothetical protein
MERLCRKRERKTDPPERYFKLAYRYWEKRSDSDNLQSENDKRRPDIGKIER